MGDAPANKKPDNHDLSDGYSHTPKNNTGDVKGPESQEQEEKQIAEAIELSKLSMGVVENTDLDHMDSKDNVAGSSTSDGPLQLASTGITRLASTITRAASDTLRIALKTAVGKCPRLSTSHQSAYEEHCRKRDQWLRDHPDPFSSSHIDDYIYGKEVYQPRSKVAEVQPQPPMYHHIAFPECKLPFKTTLQFPDDYYEIPAGKHKGFCLCDVKARCKHTPHWPTIEKLRATVTPEMDYLECHRCNEKISSKKVEYFKHMETHYMPISEYIMSKAVHPPTEARSKDNAAAVVESGDELMVVDRRQAALPSPSQRVDAATVANSIITDTSATKRLPQWVLETQADGNYSTDKRRTMPPTTYARAPIRTTRQASRFYRNAQFDDDDDDDDFVQLEADDTTKDPDYDEGNDIGAASASKGVSCSGNSKCKGKVSPPAAAAETGVKRKLVKDELIDTNDDTEEEELGVLVEAVDEVVNKKSREDAMEDGSPIAPRWTKGGLADASGSKSKATRATRGAKREVATEGKKRGGGGGGGRGKGRGRGGGKKAGTSIVAAIAKQQTAIELEGDSDDTTGDTQPQIEDSDDDDADSKCPICHKMFNASKIQEHAEKCVLENEQRCSQYSDDVRCPMCQLVFKSAALVDKHIRLAHPEPGRGANDVNIKTDEYEFERDDEKEDFVPSRFAGIGRRLLPKAVKKKL